MKRFMVFAYDLYYPLGGMKDYRDSFDDMESDVFKAYIAQMVSAWDIVYIFDRIQGTNVCITDPSDD